MMMRQVKDKYLTVLNKNTFFFSNREFEESYEGYIISLKDTLLNLRNDIEQCGISEKLISDYLLSKNNGLKAILALTGLSNELLKRVLTIIRVVDDEEIISVTHRDKWNISELHDIIEELSDNKISALIRDNKYFRTGLANLLLKGSSTSFKKRVVIPLKKRITLRL